MFSTKPFNSIFDLMQAFPNEEACIKHLESLRWDNNVVSPFDEKSTVYKLKNNKYKCRNTNKYFNVRTGTIFEGTKIPLQQWFLAIYLFTSHKKGISSHQLAKDLDITQKSAWFMLQRIRYAMEHDIFKKYMEGVIEVDETFVGGKNRNRHHDKKVEKAQGRSFKDKTPLVGLLNKDINRVICFVSTDTSKESLHPILKANIKEGSVLISDEWKGYEGLENIFQREIVDHSRKQYLNDNEATTNGIENFWSHFKRGWASTYSGRITPKHLQKYADEFSFRYNSKNDAVDDRFNLFLTGTYGKRLTYQKLIRND